MTYFSLSNHNKIVKYTEPHNSLGVFANLELKKFMKHYKASQVFVPGGMPNHTYVDRAERDLESQLDSVTENLCKLVTLTGSTKSGKTVLVNKKFPRLTGENIWIDGGTIASENDLWSAILSEIDGYSATEESENEGSAQGLGGDIEAEAGIPLIVKGKGKVSASISKRQGRISKKSLTISPRAAAINQLRESEKPLIIDDFHYLNRKFQGEVIRALKPLVFEGHPVIIIAIPHRRYDAVKVEREMTGRLKPIPVPVWSDKELKEISSAGFPLLNVELADNIADRLAREAYGSPHLMQEFCMGICTQEKILETAISKIRITQIKKSLFKKIADGTGKVVFDKLAKGPRQRSDRKPRTLVSGGTADIYRVVLLALARIAPGMEKVDYESLRAAIRETLSSEVPQSHEVSRVLEKMAEIASSDEASTPVIAWDKEEQELHVTDPFFAFFLKWGVDKTPD
ncbi:MAG: ATP-binding protein [Desulfobacula sp.]|nr:ATP-binding protein [Desulfobacula sp.]